MNKKSTALAAATLLLTAIIFLVIHFQSGNASRKSSGQNYQRPSDGPNPVTSQDRDVKKRVADREVKPVDPRHDALVAKYGKYRTNLAARIAGEQTKIWEIQLATIEITSGGRGGFANMTPLEMVRKHFGAGYGAYDKLALDPGVEATLSDAYVSFESRNKQLIKDAIEKKRENPYADMELMLVADAFKRGEISDQQFQQDHLGAIPANETDSLFEMNPMEDLGFKAVMGSVLKPSQQEIIKVEKAKYIEDITRRFAEVGYKEPAQQLQILGYPIMKLEELEQKINEETKMCEGLRIMAEAANNIPAE